MAASCFAAGFATTLFALPLGTNLGASNSAISVRCLRGEKTSFARASALRSVRAQVALLELPVQALVNDGGEASLSDPDSWCSARLSAVLLKPSANRTFRAEVPNGQVDDSLCD